MQGSAIQRTDLRKMVNDVIAGWGNFLTQRKCDGVSGARVRCHVSGIRCQLLLIICIYIYIYICLNKVGGLVDGGSSLIISLIPESQNRDIL